MAGRSTALPVVWGWDFAASDLNRSDFAENLDNALVARAHIDEFVTEVASEEVEPPELHCDYLGFAAERAHRAGSDVVGPSHVIGETVDERLEIAVVPHGAKQFATSSGKRVFRHGQSPIAVSADGPGEVDRRIVVDQELQNIVRTVDSRGVP